MKIQRGLQLLPSTSYILFLKNKTQHYYFHQDFRRKTYDVEKVQLFWVASRISNAAVSDPDSDPDPASDPDPESAPDAESDAESDGETGKGF